ncbi:sentrin-specific protease 1-like isoform X2 [Crassostrea angulata]|uniref:sentrin-specific protease 1-like isoform X2 n=1 Tax=Magallana angulata TaxID=2784310 RepID=UPI00097511BD|nr:sentrin-specific protease 1-like isoform X2 [Crassostrea angulata]XP_052677296.1 sentrin-specific protease 1-like isoform X2 [Crassostrea angulata]XP_052680436.1 sentrin-specific protease 1-like isoform X2 [Crassostrea angulata]XP_052683941.1 sentrin-specific protease 1-like isoform X2 [Crassostrea angulata]XP_052690817.1 sentrin-specific protease 1-like isoform X2 [Crassostrea angulata]|eukprot:XP_019923262.1 PREDICTED: sentrin-specific protease 1 isoform X4 [Crassostrea gigas]
MINSIFIIVYNKYGIVRGFWGIERLTPEWYPKDVPFVSPNDNKRKEDRLKREECVKVINSYKAFVLSGKCSSKNSSSHHKQETYFTEKMDVDEPGLAEREDKTDAEEIRPEPVLEDPKKEKEKVELHEPSVKDSKANVHEPGLAEREDKTDAEEPVLEDPKKEKEKVELHSASHSSKQDTDPFSMIQTILSSATKGVPKIKPGTRYHVCGEVLDKGDFNTLKNQNWLNDKVINAYLALLMWNQNKEDSNHIFVMPSYLAVLWELGRFDTWLYQKVRLSAFRWIFLPVNVHENHWVLLVANVPQRSVTILDSMNGENHTLIQRWMKYMHIRDKHVNDLQCSWTVGQLQSQRQTDGSSCGVFVLMNAMALACGSSLEALNKDCAMNMRLYVLNQLLEASRVPPAQRTLCDMEGCRRPGQREAWIGCGVCGRWCHFVCVHITEAPIEGFICPICVARYE